MQSLGPLSSDVPMGCLPVTCLGPIIANIILCLHSGDTLHIATEGRGLRNRVNCNHALGPLSSDVPMGCLPVTCLGPMSPDHLVTHRRTARYLAVPDVIEPFARSAGTPPGIYRSAVGCVTRISPNVCNKRHEHTL